MTRLPNLKISWRRGNQYTSPFTLGGWHNDILTRNVGVYLAVLEVHGLVDGPPEQLGELRDVSLGDQLQLPLHRIDDRLRESIY